MYCKNQTCPSTCSCPNPLYLKCEKEIQFSLLIIQNFKFVKLKNVINIPKNKNFSKNLYFNEISMENMAKNTKFEKLLYYFPNMVILNISRNSLEHFSSCLLSKTTFLQNLDLSFNRIRKLTNLTFLNLNNLIFLNISNNKIIKITKNALRHLNSLKELIIIENQLIFIYKTIFSNQINLKIIYLIFYSKNELTKEHFENLINLEYAYVYKDLWCCYLKSLNNSINCYFKQKILFDCNRTIPSKLLEIFILTLCVTIFFFCNFELIMEINNKEKSKKLFKYIYILIDNLISIYLLLIYCHELIFSKKIHFQLEILIQNLLCLIIKIFFIFLTTISFSLNFFHQIQIIHLPINFFNYKYSKYFISLIISILFIFPELVKFQVFFFI